MQIIKPHIRVLLIWRFLFSITMLIPAFAIAYFLNGYFYTMLIVAWFVYFVAIFAFYFPALYNSLIYLLNTDTLTLRRGVFFNNVYTIPLKQVQFTTLTANPLSRFLGIVTVHIVVPGATMRMSGLSLKEARFFSKQIMQAGEPAYG